MIIQAVVDFLKPYFWTRERVGSWVTATFTGEMTHRGTQGENRGHLGT